MRISFCITLLIFLTLIFTISSAGKPGETFPDCGYGCVASDTTLQRAWLGDASGTPINSIACSSPTTVYLWADVWDNTGTNRYCLYLWATITSGGSSTTVKQKVPTSLYYSGYVLPGHNYIPIHQFTWSCQPLSVYLNLLAWDTTPTTTCPDTAGMGCNDYYQNSKCSKNYDVPIDRPQMSLTKTSTNYGPGNPATIGDTINYQIKLTNTGNVPLKSISVSDPLLGSLSGPTGDSGTSGVLEVGEVWTYTGSYAVRPQDVCLEIKNTATANAKYYPGGGATGFSLTPVTASYSVPTRPSGAQIAVTKTYQEPYTTDSPASLNDVITYQVAVTNPGQIPLFGLSVTDTLLTLSGPAGDNGDGILQSGETWLYSGTFTVIDVCSPVTNTVTASGHVCSADYPDQVSSTATATVPVRDDALPVITGCPTDISQINNAGICGAIVTWTPPAATDNCGEVDLSSDHQPGETFPVGTTTVTYTATDDAGNSVSCSFDVTVTDDEDPAFTCPDDITQTADEGTCSATVTWTPPAATDNCGEVELSSDHEPAETFPVGTTTVTYTATDNAGNSVSCSFDVTVTDDEDPSLTCPDDITQTAAEGTCSATVTWTPPAATDNCGEVELSSDHEPAETFPVGTTTVTYTATDNAGNSVSCSFDVTVTDDEDPALTCPEDIETNTDEGVCNAQATVTEPTADDNCKIGSVQGVRSDGQALNDPYPIGTTTITWTVTDSSGHQTSCDQKVTVNNANEAVWVSAGPDQTVCSDSPVQLAGTASDQSTPTWTTRGDGSFQNPGSSSTTYYPGAGDLASGSVILTLSAIPAIACVEEVSDEILINIDPCIADVDLEKTDSPDPVIIPVNSETQLTYTVTVTNSGPSDAHDVVVTDTLPNGVDYDTADASVGTFSYDSNSRTISWRIGDLAREASPPVLTITVKVPYSIKDLEIEALSNTACLTHADADPDATDCSTATTEIIVEQEEPQIASIDVTKEASPTVAYPGDTVTFTITVSNNGEAILSPLVVEDTLPLGLIYQSDDFSGSRDISGQTITWTIDSLSPHDSPVVIHVSARVDESLQLALNKMSAEPEHIQQEPRLHVMTDSGPADGEPLAGEEIIQALLRNRTVLELRLERMIAERDSFNRSGGLCQELPSAAGGNLSVCSYTNMTDGQQLLEILDQNETLIRSEFSRTSQDDQLLSLYGPAGRSDLYTSQSTRQSLRIDYDMPAAGQKTLTIRDYQTGDTLVQVLDIAGELLSQQYRKTPGLLVPSRYLENRVKATGTDPDGLPVEGSASATVEVGLVPLPGISIDKTVTPESARPGEEVAYRIAVRNTGNVPLVDIIVSDTMLDLELDPFDLDVGEEKAFEIPYLVRQEDKSPLVNLATVVGFPLQGGDAVTDEDEATLLLAEGLFTKTATPRVVGPGDLVTYTITFHATQSGTYKIVDQYPRGVAFVSASPQPTQGDNIWVISLGQDKTVKIEILVQVAEIIGNTTFLMDQSVQGEGFVNVNNDLCTKPVILINQAFLYRQEGTAWVLYDSVSANPAKVDVQVGPPSTCASVREHGSGSYDSSDQISYRNKNSSISWNKSLSATYHPTSFDLPKNRSLSYSTKWIEKQRTQNLGLAASTNEEYTYSNRIDRESSLLMDENGTTLLVDSDFEGMAHFGAMKLKENLTNKSRWEAEPVLESREDYLGSFRVYRKMDAYGESVVANRSISGQGLVSVDQRVGESQRTHESGSGSYQVEELIDTSTSYIAKDIELAHDRSSYQLTESRWVNASGRWSEGMWSKSNPSGSGSFGGTYIGEEFHYLDRLQKETKAPGLNEMSTKASFKGTADFKAVKSDRARNHSGMDAVAYDRYVGEYEIERQIRFTGVARYDQPHLYIQKDVHVDLSSSTLADYRILVENDGNVDFAPVQVMDLFPPGTEFVDSSIRPSALQDGQANWTLRNLGVGEAVEIRLRLNITDEEDNLVNRVLATGTHEDGQTVASNFSAVQLSWLTCCPPQLDARKTANVVNNTTMVLYRISLTNREDYTMVAFIQDHLPDGMSLVSSTVDPSYQHGSEVAWTIVDLQPGETRVIEYLSSAPGDGIYANSAHVEVYSVDGPDAASADLVARVEVGGTGRVASSRSGWHPPTCFGLSCPASLQAPDWVPCSACGRSEPTPDYACPDCTPV